MNTVNFKTIFVGLFLAVISSHLIVFGHTVLDMLTQTKLKMPLTAYLFWGYLPMIVSGMYVGFSTAKGKVLIAALVGGLFYSVLWLISSVSILSSRFDHSLNPVSFALGLVRNGFVCSVAAWVTHTVLKRRRREVK